MKEEELIDNKRFWRDNHTWRSTNTGMNANVIGTYIHINDRRDLVAHIRDNIVPYSDGRRFLESTEKKDYFVDVVNECMKNIYRSLSGYVFSDSQLKEVLMIKPDVSIRWSNVDNCYYCCK